MAAVPYSLSAPMGHGVPPPGPCPSPAVPPSLAPAPPISLPPAPSSPASCRQLWWLDTHPPWPTTSFPSAATTTCNSSPNTTPLLPFPSPCSLSPAPPPQIKPTNHLLPKSLVVQAGHHHGADAQLSSALVVTRIWMPVAPCIFCWNRWHAREGGRPHAAPPLMLDAVLKDVTLGRVEEAGPEFQEPFKLVRLRPPNGQHFRLDLGLELRRLVDDGEEAGAAAAADGSGGRSSTTPNWNEKTPMERLVTMLWEHMRSSRQILEGKVVDEDKVIDEDWVWFLPKGFDEANELASLSILNIVLDCGVV